MKNNVMARGYFEEGRTRSGWVEKQLAAGHWSTAVRESQESVELLLKGALRLVGIEVPRTHDVAEILLLEQTRFPSSFRRLVPRLAEISMTLAKWRGPSFYGDEKREIPPNALFDKSKASVAARGLRFALGACKRLFESADREDKRNNKGGK